MPARDGDRGARFALLYEHAAAARAQARATRSGLQSNREIFEAQRQQFRDARRRAQLVREVWLVPHDPDRLRFSAHARLVARLAFMPVIEQAKGILMAQYGWQEDQAFDALRQASQRANIKVRDLATRIVTATVSAAPPAGRSSPGPGQARRAQPAGDAEVVITIPTPPQVAAPRPGRLSPPAVG